MSKHTPTPWKVTGKHFIDSPIGGGKLQEVAWCGDVESGNREANARHIVHCVNYHDRLVEALGDVVAGWASGEDIFGPIQKACALLAELDNLEQTK